MHVERKYVSSAIVLFVLTSLFVLQNQVVFVVINVTAAHDSCLSNSVHNLTIGKQRLGFVLVQLARANQPSQILASRCIDFVCIGVGFGRQVNFRANDT